MNPPPTTAGGPAVSEKALRRWAAERLHREPLGAGGVRYHVRLSGSTCTKLGRPIESVLTVTVGTDGRITGATAAPAPADDGWPAMCAAAVAPDRFRAGVAACDEVLGLTLEEAAFRDWAVEESGCLCTAGNRRHKWRNALQTIAYATRPPGGGPSTP